MSEAVYEQLGLCNALCGWARSLMSDMVALLLTWGCCGGVVLRSNMTEAMPYLPSSAARVCPVGPPPHIATG